MSAWRQALAAVLAILLSACGGSLTDAADDTATTQPVDCRHHTEQCI